MFYVSYFYNIRFFDSSIVPVSTATWDPKWYHNFENSNTIFRDKNNVINGLRADILTPTKIYDSSSDCQKDCKQNPENCTFIKKYSDYLNSLNFEEVTTEIQKRVSRLAPGADICLIVYEAVSNPCGERRALRQWFEMNGSSLPEWER